MFAVFHYTDDVTPALLQDAAEITPVPVIVAMFYRTEEIIQLPEMVAVFQPLKFLIRSQCSKTLTKSLKNLMW